MSSKVETSRRALNSTGEIGRIGRHRAETHRYFNIRFFGPMPPDASDFPGGIPALIYAESPAFWGLISLQSFPGDMPPDLTIQAVSAFAPHAARTSRHPSSVGVLSVLMVCQLTRVS